MKRFGLAVCAAFIAFSGYASAQEANSASASGVIANIQGAAGAQSNNTFTSPSDTTVRYEGGYETVPGVMAPSFSSGHPCAFAPGSIGIVALGGGFTGGGQRIDDACLLAQMGMQQEAIAMIAARNSDACQALAATGKIARESCGRDERRFNIRSTGNARVSTMSAPTPRPDVAYSKCEFDGAIRVSVKAGQNRDLAISQCRASLGR